jgi:hypothetical protein
MSTVYELRTARGKSVFSYDCLERARIDSRTHERRIGVKLHIFKVTRVEEAIV